MRAPALAIAAAFGCGIVAGFAHAVTPAPNLRFVVAACLVATTITLLAALLLVAKRFLHSAALISLFAWFLLGATSAVITQQPRLPEFIINLVASGQIDLSGPLHWHGYLRDEPTQLPWGVGYEVELTGVDLDGGFQKTTGGMRLATRDIATADVWPDLHAGDEIAFLTQARLPQTFRDEGAFDRRTYLTQQNIDLVATLRAPLLLEKLRGTVPSFGTRLVRLPKQVRARLLSQLDRYFAADPANDALLRAMLLGDRTFVDRAESESFQKTGVFHVLVVAGLHVGAIFAAMYWLSRKLRLSKLSTIALALIVLSAYVAIVQQRPPVMRAALMAVLVLLGNAFYRRLDLLNSAALAGLILLIAAPSALRDSSFQLTFVAIAFIGGVAIPWLERTVQPYVRALQGWRDLTRDAAHQPRATQFRIDLRSFTFWLCHRAAPKPRRFLENHFVRTLSSAFWILELLTISFVLQLGMMPELAGDFHRLSLVGPFVNLAAFPATVLIVPLGFITLTAGAVWLPAGNLLSVPLGWLASALVHVVSWAANFSHASYRIPSPPTWLVVAFFAFTLLLVISLRAQFQRATPLRSLALASLLVTAALIAVYPFSPRLTEGTFELNVLDVGQGDSLLLVSPRGHTILIDGGGSFGGFPGSQVHATTDPGEDAVSPYLWSRGFKHLDVVAVTHAHQDHIGGLTAVLENFRVGRLWIGREVSAPALLKLEALAKIKSILVEHESHAAPFDWDGVQVAFLWPEQADASASSAKNNDSLVMRVQYKNKTFLLPGDAEKQAERQIVAENPTDSLYADVLKVGHHGSKNSTNPEFLAAVHPAIAIISAGQDNPYGHPSPELLGRLSAAGSRILRTDRNGAIHIQTDGYNLHVTCFVACPEPPATTASVTSK